MATVAVIRGSVVRTHHALRVLGLSALMLTLAACGGSSSTSRPPVTEPPPADTEGVFINAPVVNLGYAQPGDDTARRTTTEPAGGYACDEEATVSWQIGDLVLGSSACLPAQTFPADLLCGDTGGDLCAINLSRFLQAHGAADAEDIRITEQAHVDASGLMIDFNLPVDDFAAQFAGGGAQAYLVARLAESGRSALPDAFDACEKLAQSMLMRDRLEGIPDCAPYAPQEPPRADAGPDQTAMAGDTVLLDGSASDEGDAALVTFAWQQSGGESVVLQDQDQPVASFPVPDIEPGSVLTFTLTVTDEDGLSSEDSTRVTVLAAPNQPPVADAGADQLVTAGDNVVLSGVGSSDPDGDIVSALWEQLSGPAVVLSNADTLVAEFEAPLVADQTTLRFRLVVTDDQGAQGSDQTQVTVMPRAGGEEPPPDEGGFDGLPSLLLPFEREQCDDTVAGFGGPADEICGGLFALPNAVHNECVQLSRPLLGERADLLCNSLFSAPMPPVGAIQAPASCATGDALEGGRSYPVYLESESRETIAFQVLEPIGGIDCDNGHALVLHGHGFGGSRSLSGFNDYREAGFTVISIDSRGFGESSGTVRVMDPEFEGRDLIRILDWAEDNLDFLMKRDKPGLPPELNPNLVVGAMGGSYGGGFQMLLHGQDPRQRLDALVPDITWHDLRYSLNPGNVIKTGWDLFLVLGGEAGSQPNRNGGLDPIIRETLVRGLATNTFPDQSLDFFYYHSPAYRCNGEPIPERALDPNGLLLGLLNPPAYDTPPDNYPMADVLLTQGMRDTLFNFNEAWHNFDCLRERGGDVRLLTHQSGHILPLEVPEAIQPGTYVPPPIGNLLNIPGFQRGAGGFACGDISVSRATRDWMRYSLLREPLPAYFDGTEDQVCLSLDDGASVLVPMADFPAPVSADLPLSGPYAVERQVSTTTPVPSGFTAVATATVVPAVMPLGTVGPEGAVLGGIPTAQLTVSDLLGRDGCAVELPLLSVGCDPTVFIGIGRRAPGAQRWQLVDDQIMPVRGLKRDAVVHMVGIAEALPAGEELALLAYGFHPQYPASWSRDALVPFVNIDGSVQLPLLEGVLSNPLDTAPPPVNLIPEITEVCAILGLPLLRPVCQQVDNLVDTLLAQCDGPLDPACGLADDLVDTINGLLTGIGLTGPADLSLLVTGADASLRGCDLLDPAHCLYPFPSNHFTATVPDGTPSMATGRRVRFNPLGMPSNIVGKPIDPTDWNRNDGFSPGQLITTLVPGLDMAQTYQAPLDQLGIADPRRSLTHEAFANGWGRPPVLVLEVQDEESLDTREHLVWVEQDVNAGLFLPTGELFGDDIDRVGEARSAVLVRPAKNFIPGRRYVVVMRDLRDAEGASIAPSVGFQVCRDQLASSIPSVQGRCAALEQDVFPVLEAAGIHRDSSLYLAWDFTVASTENITGRLVHMRDDAFASLSRTGTDDCLQHDDSRAADCAPPTFTVDTVDLDADNGRMVKIDGTLMIPSYLLPADTSPLARPEVRRLIGLFDDVPLAAIFDNDAYDIVESASLVPPNRLNYSPFDALVPPSATTLDLQRYGDALPDRMPVVDEISARYTCEIPRDAYDGLDQPSRASLYGHGLLQGRVALTYDHPGGRSRVAYNYNTMFCAIDWFGFAQGDLPNILLTLLDLSNFGIIPDASQQGMLNWMFLARAMLHPDGFAAHPAFRQGGNAAAAPAFDRSDVFYYGNSQGGILPGPVQAVSPDINRGVYGVPGMNYSLLLRRSKDFTLYSIPLYLAYPDELDRNLAFALIQMLWDRGENSGFAAYLTERDKAVDGTQPNLSGTDNYVLLHTAFADQEVTHWSVDMMARTMGAPVDDRDTLRYPGLNPDIAPYYDIPRLQFDAQGRAPGSANMVWVQPGVLSPPLANIPPTEGPNPHGYPRGHGGANCQIHHFLQRDGFIADVLDYSAQRDTQVQRCLSDFGVGAP
ncbi:MAG: hypothetical protein LAT61_02915 [Alcanivorax sp.]|nr:hypothetical protein [Alcanivorax sp.]